MECETSQLPGPSSAVAPTSCAASVASLGSTGSGLERAAKQAEMVATLQARRSQLEAKLAAKNEELKMLCIQEAELTGVLPPEIPLDPGETPPTLRRRVGTSFTLPESLLNKLRSTEEESVAAVELEVKIQTGIAEAALGLANDTSANKQVRRKHRLMYQQSQRRLQDLEAKLKALREKQELQEAQAESSSCAQPQQPTQQQHLAYQQQIQQQNQLKHRKKPRPPVDTDTDVAEVDGMLHAGGISLSPLSHIDRDIRDGRGVSSALTASTNTVGLPLQPTSHRHSSYRYSTIDSSWTIEPDRLTRRDIVQTGGGAGGNYWNSSLRQEIPSPGSSRYSGSRYPSGVPVDVEDTMRPASQRWKRDRSMMGMSRFGSLDRRRAGGATVGSSSASSNVNSVDEVETGVPALLPNQTYPEHSLGHSLVRTQSLGSVEASRPRNLQSERDSSRDGSQTIDRKPKEKEWYETSLDVAPILSPQGSQGEPQNQLPQSSHPPLQASLSHPPPHPHLYQSHPQLHHAPHQSPSLALPLSQSHSHSHLAQSLTSVPASSHHNHHAHNQTPPSFSSTIPQSQSHPQLHPQSQRNPPQIPPHSQLHAKLSATQSVSHLTVHIPPQKPHPPPLPPPSHLSQPSHQHSTSQPPAIPPHAPPPSIAPPLPPHPSSHSPAQSQPPPPPLPPSHSSLHNSPQLPPQLPPHTQGHLGHTSAHQPMHTLHPPPLTLQSLCRQGPPEIPPHVPIHAPNHHLVGHVSSHNHTPPPPPPHPPLSPKSDDGPLSPPQVPLESPKNHMVVQAGSWQPYREVTKPFEMSDFYKYSTKFRKQMQQPPPALPLSPDGAPPSPHSPQQQKGVYTPLQPLTCQPVEPHCASRASVGVGIGDTSLGSPAANSESLADAFSSEMLAWFQDQRAAAQTPAAAPPPPTGPPPRSATLV